MKELDTVCAIPDKNKVYVVGVLDSGAGSLTPAALSLVNRAEVLIGGHRQLSFFPGSGGQKHVLTADLSAAVALVRQELGKKLVAVLASGDPNFFGIGRYLGLKLGRDRLELLPNLTSLQLLFARIKEPWDDAALVSAHARPLESVLELARTHSKLGILTDNVNTPGALARALQQAGILHFRAFVGHNLGGQAERVYETGLEELSKLEVPEPNVIALVASPSPLTGEGQACPERSRRGEGAPVPSPLTGEGQGEGDVRRTAVLGIPDEQFQRSRPGMITKMEVRAISLAKLGLTPSSVVWDVGAGSGAVAIEAARLCPHGRVYAIEKDAEMAAIARRNAGQFALSNLEVVSGEAPGILATLEKADSIFIGGTGGKLEAIVSACLSKLKPGGRLVANVIAFEHMGILQAVLPKVHFDAEVTMVNIARSQNIKSLTRFEPLNPVFIVAARRAVVK